MVQGSKLIQPGSAFQADVAEQLNRFSVSDRARVCKRIALSAVDTVGGLFSWQNNTGDEILVDEVVVNLVTASTAACTANIGTDDDGADSDDSLIDGLNLNAAAGVFNNRENPGTNGTGQGVKVPAGEYVLGSVASGASAGIVGWVYIWYYHT